LLVIKDNFNQINLKYSRNKYCLLAKDIERVITDNPFSRFVLILYKILANYGESPLILFIWAFAIIIGFGTLNWAFHLTDATCWPQNIYLSAITFFTVGYGDYKPITTLGQILLALEGFLGVFLMSLFVVTFTKQAFED